LFFSSKKSPHKGPKFFMPDKDSKKKKTADPQKVSLDPLYDSTDKYRRVVKPFEVEELFSSTPQQSD
jgi:hypothetical protein